MTFKKELPSSYTAKLAFLSVVFAWSTSWLMIKFQVEKVPEGLSVAYRFLGASLVLFTIAKLNNFPLKFTKSQHRLIFLQGINLFFFNHLFFYSAIHYVSSGVAATFSALSVITVPVIDYFVHKTKLSSKLFTGAILGIIGVILISSSEINVDHFDKNIAKGLFFCSLGVISFSFGSVIGKELKLNNMKVLISSTAFSMLYGATLSLLVGWAVHKNLSFDFSPSYIFSLLYLILIPGILGYCAILFLVDKVGSANAAYTALLYPVFALILSGIFEDYKFTIFTILGIVLVIAGNLIALRARKKQHIK